MHTRDCVSMCAEVCDRLRIYPLVYVIACACALICIRTSVSMYACVYICAVVHTMSVREHMSVNAQPWCASVHTTYIYVRICMLV